MRWYRKKECVRRSPPCDGLPATGSQVPERIRLWRASHFVTQYVSVPCPSFPSIHWSETDLLLFSTFQASLSTSTRSTMLPSAKKASLTQVYSRPIHTTSSLQSMRLRMRPELAEKTKNWYSGVEKGSPEFNVRASSSSRAYHHLCQSYSTSLRVVEVLSDVIFVSLASFTHFVYALIGGTCCVWCE